MKRKIVFFDVDGTIYHNSVGVVADAIEGIKRLRNNGHLAFICTGRAIAGIDDCILEIGFDGIIAGCGTYIKIGDEVIENVVASKENIDVVIDQLVHKKGYFIILEGNEHMYMGYDAAPIKEKARFSRFVENNASRIRSFDDKIENVNKFCLRLDEGIDNSEAINLLEGKFYPIVHTSSTIEFVPLGYDKGTGVNKVLEYYKIDKEDSIAFGDSYNDLPMLEAVGTSVVLENGAKAAKDMASIVTGKILEGGVGNALKELGLWEK